MKEKDQGQFSLSLMSLQLQMKTLLEDAGGDEVVNLLDSLCRVNKSEQEIILKIFSKVISRIASGEIRLNTRDDHSRKQLEDSLYNEIVTAIDETPSRGRIKLEVFDGGKCARRKVSSAAVVDIDELRLARKTGTKPIIN